MDGSRGVLTVCVGGGLGGGVAFGWFLGARVVMEFGEFAILMVFNWKRLYRFASLSLHGPWTPLSLSDQLPASLRLQTLQI